MNAGLKNVELMNTAWINKIRKTLVDKESRILFDARMDYMFTGDEDKYFDVIESLPHEWKCVDRDIDNKEEIIIFGCGRDGRKTNRVLRKSGYAAKYFCDSNISGRKVDGLEVISVDELFEKHSGALVILGSAKYNTEMYYELRARGWPKNRMIKPQYGIVRSKTGAQYFDFFPCEKKEVFVDAGGFDGKTTLEFAAWTGENYGKVFILEPLTEMCDVIERSVKQEGLDNIVINNCAAWNKEEKLYFYENSGGSKIVEEEGMVIQGRTIDNIVGEEQVTYIKMDIEGSELKALQGAKQTILRCKPKLAICIYHKPGDIIVLSSYILELVPEYKLAIRHYCSNMWETVLYAY